MKSICVFALFLLSLPLLAQEDTTTVVARSGYVKPQDTYSSRRYQGEDVGGKKFDEKKWKEAIDKLNYDEEKEKEEKPKKDEEKVGDGRDFKFKINPSTLRIYSFLLVFVLFAFILYYVAQNTKFKQKIKKMTPADAAAPLENIEELDTEGLLGQALEAGDLRMAVRIQYLRLLKKLNEVGLIVWKKDKTNREYLSELYGRNDCYENVRGLTLAYELVWYGDHSVSNESFQRLRVEFEFVNNRINQVQPEA